MAGIEYFPAMDLIEKLMTANPTLYREFIMVSVKTSKSRTEDFYVGLPSKPLLALFEGFDTVEEADLPKVIDTLHVADVASFEARFLVDTVARLHGATFGHEAMNRVRPHHKARLELRPIVGLSEVAHKVEVVKSIKRPIENAGQFGLEFVR